MAEPLRITIHPDRFTPGPAGGSGEDLAGTDGAWGAGAPDHKPQVTGQPSKPEDIDGAWGASRADHSQETEAAAKTLHRDVSGGEAFAQGLGSGISFGAAPVAEGVAAAGGPQPTDIAGRASGAAAWRPIEGLGKMIAEGFSGESMKAYRKGRDEAQERLDQAREQHPYITLGGEAAGSLAAPIPGGAALTQGASLAGRLGRGAVAGAEGGALYGAGSAVSKGKDWSDVVTDAALNAGYGAGIGAAFHGALGPRAPQGAPTTPGQRAAQTARDIGAPLPRGLTSDSRAVQATTSTLRGLPLAGPRIGHAVDATQQAAGRRIEQIAAGNRGTAPDRALAGSVLRPALEGVIDDNMGLIDQAYNGLRNQINPHLYGATPHTRAALDGVIRQRRGARVANPEAGFGDILNLVRGGIGFNGLQRARNALGRMIDFHEQNPHPGFDVRDLRRIYAAMSGDMEGIVRQHARGNPAQAVNALRGANQAADLIIDQNRAVQRVLNVQGERLVGSLLTAAQERTGNLQLLANLRASMPADDFHHIAGVMLAELGHNNTTGEFSLNQFVRGWDRVSNGARNILFSPQHLQNINDIVGMGRHIRGALRESSTSHSAGIVVLLDVAKDAVLLGGDLASGGLGLASAVGAGTTAGLWMLARWLGNPAQASSMNRWLQAHRALADSATAGRLAAFNVATRNLANTLGIPQERIARHSPASIGTGSGPAALPIPSKFQERVPVSR
jgi:hypothetical protein